SVQEAFRGIGAARADKDERNKFLWQDCIAASRALPPAMRQIRRRCEGLLNKKSPNQRALLKLQHEIDGLETQLDRYRLILDDRTHRAIHRFKECARGCLHLYTMNLSREPRVLESYRQKVQAKHAFASDCLTQWIRRAIFSDPQGWFDESASRRIPT